MGARYSQSAISFSQVIIDFPITAERAVHFVCDDKQMTNCHNTEIIVSGYM